MNRLIEIAASHARLFLTALALIFLAGLYAYSTIPKESSPDVPIPFFYVSLTHQGISPEDSERLLIKPMETFLKGMQGLKEVKGIAYEGGGAMVLEFDAGFDPNRALLDVREKVDQAKSELPEETDEPIVTEFNASLFPVVTVVIYGDVPERMLVRLARDLRDELESLPGVLEAELTGHREELLEAIVDPVLLESYAVSEQDLINVVLRNNRLVAAGSLDTGDGRFAVKVPGVFASPSDVLALPIKVKGDGVVTLGDLGKVRQTFVDPTSFARIDGKPAVSLTIRKRAGENIIATIDAVRETVEMRQKFWPAGLQVEFLQDQSVYIRDMLQSLQNSIVSAVLLVFVVIVAAMGGRSAGLVGMAVPGSFLLAILVLYIGGFTVNQVVMFGLILAVGMLVDSAIVVTEYADRKLAEGIGPHKSYVLAAQRMAWPIIASTATTLAAFVPLLFWPGVMGGFMKYLPLTLIMTLTASLVMALIFLPTLGARLGRAPREDRGAIAHLAGDEHDLDSRSLPGLAGAYTRFLARMIARPWRFLLSLLGVGILVFAAYVMTGPKVVLFPEGEPDYFSLQVHARGNLSIHERDAHVRQVEEAVRDLPGVHKIYTSTGMGGGFGRDQGEDMIGSVMLILDHWRERPRASALVEEARRRTAGIPGIVVEPLKQEMGPVEGKGIDIDVTAADPTLIEPAVAKLRHFMETEMTGLTDIEDTRPLPGVEWVMVVDRAEAGRYGADISSVGSIVQMVTNGIKVGDYRPADSTEEVDIRVRFPEDKRRLEKLNDLRIQTPFGNVPVSNFVTREPRPRVTTIERIDGNRVISVRANVAEGHNIFEKLVEIRDFLMANSDDPRVRYMFRGQQEEQQNATAFLSEAFFIALFLMAIILLAQFNSFYQATLILSAVLLSLVGVVLGMLLTGRDFVLIMTGVGIISLAGIVVNNNIILIDTFNHLRSRGLPVTEAILRTGAQRLRPVMLTTITTIIGLLPMCFGLDINFINRDVVFDAPSAAFWVDLAIAIVFGLAFSTILTLIATPCLLALRYRREERRQAAKAAAEPKLKAAE